MPRYIIAVVSRDGSGYLNDVKMTEDEADALQEVLLDNRGILRYGQIARVWDPIDYAELEMDLRDMFGLPLGPKEWRPGAGG